MSTSRPTVTVGFDDTTQAQAAVHWAAHEALARKALLRIVSAWDASPVVPWSVGVWPEWRDQARAAAVAAVERARDGVGGGLDVESIAREGSAASVLEDESALCDLLVLGSAGHVGLGGLLTGSVSRHCLHHAHAPLVVLGPHAQQDATSRLVLSSSLDPDHETFDWVIDRLRLDPRPIHVLTTFDASMGLAELALNDAQQAIRSSVRAEHDLWVSELKTAIELNGVGPAPVTDDVLEGPSLQVLADHTHAGDLLVVPSGCAHAVPFAHGSCPILVLPAHRRATVPTPVPAPVPAADQVPRPVRAPGLAAPSVG